jgi:hypothetical protein
MKGSYVHTRLFQTHMAGNKSIAVLLLLLACVDISAMLITPVDTDVILFEPVEITTPTRSVSRIDLGVVVLEYDDSDEGSDDSDGLLPP